MLTITTNAALVAGQLQDGERQLPQASGAAREALAESALESSQGFLQEIYDQPDTDELVGGDYLGHYVNGDGRFIRTGALKAAEILLRKPGESVIMTRQGLVSGPRGTKNPSRYAEERAYDSRGAGSYWRERAAEEAESEGGPVAEKAFVEAMPDGLVTP